MRIENLGQLGLPREPVDGYKVIWWEVHWEGEVSECTATYYEHTAWKDYSPDVPGADLDEVWMISRGRIPEGRILGWNGLGDMLIDKRMDPHYTTWEAAAARAEQNLEARRTRLFGDLQKVQLRLKALRREKEERSKAK